MGNRKSFTITKRIRSSFTIVIDGFSQLLSWIANISIGEIQIEAIPIMLAKMASLIISFNEVSVSAIIHLISGFSSSISFIVGYAADSIGIKYSLYPTVDMGNPSIVALRSSIFSLSGIAIDIPIGFSSTDILVGVKNYLGDFVGRNPISSYYDDSTLGSMDSTTLGDLDFTETT